MAISTSDARAAVDALNSSLAAVSTVMNELGQGTTPSLDEVAAAIAASSTIANGVSSIASQDSNGNYSLSTGAIATQMGALQKVLYDEQSNIASHAGTGFIQPPDPTTLANAAAAWSAIQAQLAAIVTQANTIDITSAQSAAASQQAAAQAQAAGGSGGSSSSSSGGSASGSGGSSGSTGSTTPTTSTTATPPTTTATLPPAVVATSSKSSSTTAPSATASASVLPAVSPAAAVFVGIGLLVVVGLATGYLTVPKEVTAVGSKLGLTKKKRRGR